jgi:hypothetical protein
MKSFYASQRTKSLLDDSISLKFIVRSMVSVDQSHAIVITIIEDHRFMRESHSSTDI